MFVESSTALSTLGERYDQKDTGWHSIYSGHCVSASTRIPTNLAATAGSGVGASVGNAGGNETVL